MLQIALVEDNAFHAMLFEQAVRDRYPESRISVYPTAQAYLRDMSPNGDDLIAVDYDLPDMDGLQLLTQIRAEKPDTPIILITGVGSEQIAVEAMKSGATDYIAKTGDYGATIPRVIKQAYHKQQLILKNRRLEEKARHADKLQILTSLISTLNHEINNPLMAVLGNVELLLEDNTFADETAIEKLKIIEASARRIQTFTHQMANVMSAPIRLTPAGPMLELPPFRGEKERVGKAPAHGTPCKKI